MPCDLQMEKGEGGSMAKVPKGKERGLEQTPGGEKRLRGDPRAGGCWQIVEAVMIMGVSTKGR